jgi:Cu(I)/Ag(I) efflux system membrane fusion protein
MKRRAIVQLVIGLVGLAALAVIAGCGGKNGGPGKSADRSQPMYHCPMHPQVVAERPGDCPICFMRLVPIEESQGGTSETADPGGMAAPAGEAVASAGSPAGYAPVTIDTQKQQLIGLRLATVVRGPFETTIRTVGRIAFDETRVHHVHTRYEGFIEQVFADFTGKVVRKGEPLASIYSPDLLATQEEYLLALEAARAAERGGDSANRRDDLLEAARRRLLLWEIGVADIDALERTGKPSLTLNLYAPITGVVTARIAYHGMKVGPEDALFDLADLSRVWVLADVYEYELPRLSVGLKGTMTLPYWPGREWAGRVTYIFPTVEEKTRTVKIRIEFENPDGDLKPGMFADVVLHGESRMAMIVPDDAVLDSGLRKIVFVSQGQGRLAPREVVTGDRAGGVTEILSGLAEGDSIAAGANFLLDSESRLRAAISAAKPAGAASAPPGAAGHQHGAGDD